MTHFFKAGRFLLEDLLSTLLFVGLFVLTGNLYLATGVAIAVGVVQAVWTRMQGRSLDAMQVLSLVLVVVMGGATLLTHDPRFVMVKPTLVLGAVGAVMLRRGWMNRYLPPVVIDVAPDVGVLFGYLWAGLMFATAAASLALALLASPALWAGFMVTVPLVSKVGLFLVQFAVLRLVVRRRLAARRAGEVAAPA
ncbi:MAG: septation protein IspZ [Caulobacter sp.]|nr:septation protein IspZ [Caulobacter sp.]